MVREKNPIFRRRFGEIVPGGVSHRLLVMHYKYGCEQRRNQCRSLGSREDHQAIGQQ
jgi:hypothetical protein